MGILEEALKRFDEIQTRERDQRFLAVEDMRFAHSEDGQWEESAITKRRDRPRFTLNRIAGAIDQICGDQRQTRTQIKVRPVKNGSNDLAKVQAGLIRNIEQNSDAESIYDAAFDEAVTCGFGGWRVRTDFSDDDVFDQEIIIEPVRSAVTSLFFDPSSIKQDKRDSMYAFYVQNMNLDEFKKKFPKATITDFSNEQYYSGFCNGWFSDNVIRVAEYWVVNMEDVELAQLSDGRVINLNEEKKVLDELVSQGIKVIKTRKSQIRKVESYLINGSEVLEGPMEWAGKYIPLVPVYGRTFYIEGKEHIRGVVRLSKDPQRIYNYATSNAIEATALSPKDPIWITTKQASGHETKLRTFNTSNSPFMFYNPDSQSPGPPVRTGAPSVQQSLISQVGQAALDIYATTGIQPPSLGLNPEMQSGKAIIAQQKMGDRSTFVFSDNLHKSIKFTGELLIDLIPRIYDTQRVVTVLGFDGSTEEIEINVRGIDELNEPIIDGQTGEQVIVNDLSQGKYETFVDAGPAYTTLRQESAQQLIDLATGSPRFEALATDLIAKNLDILEHEELTKRIRMQMIRDGVVQPTEEETQEMGLNQIQKPSPEQQALLENVQMQTAQMAASIENKNADSDYKDAKTLQTKLQAQETTIDAYNKLIDAYNTQQQLGIDLGIDEQMVRKAQIGIISLSQEELVQNSA